MITCNQTLERIVEMQGENFSPPGGSFSVGHLPHTQTNHDTIKLENRNSISPAWEYRSVAEIPV